MKNLIYYMALEYPIEINKEWNKDKLISVEEIEYVDDTIRTFIKNDYIYEIKFNELETDKAKDLLKELIKNNLFNECNVIELYCNSSSLEKEDIRYMIKDIEENVFFEEGYIINVGNFNINVIDKNFNKSDKKIKILGYKLRNNSLIVDILSNVIFYYGENKCIEEIGTDVYIQGIEINNKNVELDFSQTIYILEDKNLEIRANAFENAIFLKYELYDLINKELNDVCITRLVYKVNNRLREIKDFTIKIDFGDEVENYSL